MKINVEKMLLWLKDKKESTENFTERCAETQNYFGAIEARSEAFMLEYIIDYIERGEDYRNGIDDNQFGWIEED